VVLPLQRSFFLIGYWLYPARAITVSYTGGITFCHQPLRAEAKIGKNHEKKHHLQGTAATQRFSAGGWKATNLPFGPQFCQRRHVSEGKSFTANPPVRAAKNRRSKRISAPGYLLASDGDAGWTGRSDGAVPINSSITGQRSPTDSSGFDRRRPGA